MQEITIEYAVQLMRTSESIQFYEYYDGLHVDTDMIIPCESEELTILHEKILKELPNSKLISFEYCSRFSSETHFENLTIPDTLQVLTLANFSKVDVEKILHVECHHQDEEYYADDEIDIVDDSGKYILVENKWTQKS
jgi:hypothetical protein